MHQYQPASTCYVFATIEQGNEVTIRRWRVGRDGRLFRGWQDKVRARYPAARVSFGAPFEIND